MELELKHLAPYLPYKINCLHEGDIKEIIGIRNWLGWCYTITDKTGETNSPIRACKLVLRPLSDLKDYIKYFLIENSLYDLSKCGFEYNNEDDSEIWCNAVNERGNVIDCLCYNDYYFEDMRNDHRVSASNNQLQLFSMLFKFHFDVFELIPVGLAISINDIK